MEATLNDHRLYYETSGTAHGPAVVLLHHGLGSTGAWRETVPALVEAGLRVTAFDRWGYGRSAARPRLAIPSFEDDLQDLRLLLDHLEIGQANLVGHSDGGTIALYFAGRWPKRVNRLVVVAAHIYVEDKMKPGIENVRRTFESKPRFRQGLARAHGNKVESVFRNWYEGWAAEPNLNWDMRPDLEKVAAPTLVVQGLEDEHATPQHARDLAEALPQGELWLVPGAGHMLPQEHAPEFNRRVLEFLNR